MEIAVPDLAIDLPDQPLPGFGAPHEQWLDCGRSALGAIARDLLDRGAARRIWLPAYACESIVTPFRRAGFEVAWYGVGESLDRLDADPRSGETLLFIHYFGRRHAAALQRAEALMREGVWLVEDCVQAPLTSGVGVGGHYAISSLRKFFALPDGALLASRAPVACPLVPPDEGFVSARLAGKLLRADGGDPEVFLGLFDWAEQRLDADLPRRMSWISTRLLRRADLSAIATRRRRNAALLLQAICASPRLRDLVVPGISWSADEVPFGMPLRVADKRRDALRTHLASNAIYCPVHWNLRHLPPDGFAEERRLSESLLTIPIDQRLDDKGVARIVDALCSFAGDPG